MQVSIVRGGGIGGFTTRTTLDADSLPAGERNELAKHVSNAIAAEAPSTTPPSRQPDELLYEIAVTEGAGTKTVRFTESQLPRAAQDLVTWVDARPEKTTALATS